MNVPIVPYLDRKKRSVENLTDLWSYINPFMLFGRHLGYKGNFERDLRERVPKALALFERIEEVKQEAAGSLAQIMELLCRLHTYLLLAGLKSCSAFAFGVCVCW